MASTRRLAAILAADVAGYSRLMGMDEEGTHERLQAHRRELVEPKIGEHSGRVVKNTGDGMLAEFPSVVDAVRCAVELQRAMTDREAGMPEDRRIRFRIGINLGDVIVEEHDIFGDGVNVAARLEALAEPGGICISRTVRDQIRDKLPYAFEDLGEQSVKNIARPVRVYALRTAVHADLSAPTVPAPPPITQPAVAPRLSIVVLPFANLSSDPEQEYFADGITDDLTTDLSRISGSFVIARNTAFTFKGKSIDAKQIGRELGVRYVLEGSVRRTGAQVRVNAQLIDAESGAHLWADRFDTDLANLGQAQDEITGRLARTLNLELLEDVGRRIEQQRAIDPDARDLVMRGWAWFYQPRSPATVQEALEAFEQALSVDPQSIGARIGIATVLVTNLTGVWNSSFQHDQEVRAERLLLEALERDTNQSMAHYAMGLLRRSQNRLTEARIELETAIALDRNNARAFHQLGHTLRYLGEPEEAIPQIEKAIQLNPRDPFVAHYYHGLGSCHLLLGHADLAADMLTRARAGNPRYWYIHLSLAGALGLKGDLDAARAALADAIKLEPRVTSLAQWHAHRRWARNPKYLALAEKTLHVGLRRAGFPDE
jgi:TolB-like protein/class 3 adenylate cyclase/Flp pilus assembly protein TadD